MSKWQPISTAPVRDFDRDNWFIWHSPRVIVWNGQCMYLAHYTYTRAGRGRWMDDNARIIRNVTLWQRAPKGPSGKHKE